MSKTPPIPEDQQGVEANLKDMASGRQALPIPDPADANLDEQGQSGNLRQNQTPQRSTQDR